MGACDGHFAHGPGVLPPLLGTDHPGASDLVDQLDGLPSTACNTEMGLQTQLYNKGKEDGIVANYCYWHPQIYLQVR